MDFHIKAEADDGTHFSIAQCILAITVMAQAVLASNTRSEGSMQIMLRSHVLAFAKTQYA